MFKSLTIFNFGQNIPDNPANCQIAIKEELAPMQISDLEQIAWASPYGPGHESYICAGSGFIFLTVARLQTLMQPSIISQYVAEKISIIRNQEQREPSKREKIALKEKITEEIRAKALIKKQMITILIDTNNRRLIIASSQKSVVDACLDLIYKTFPKVSLSQIETQIPAISAMKSWLTDKNLNTKLTLLPECELRNSNENSVIKFKGLDLHSESILNHICEDTLVQKLSLVFDEKVQFVLNADGSITSIKFLEYVQTAKANIFTENMQAEIDADLIVSADALTECLNSLISILGGVVTAEVETV